jgi:hypothetical protein
MLVIQQPTVVSQETIEFISNVMYSRSIAYENYVHCLCTDFSDAHKLGIAHVQSVPERWRQTLGMSSTCENKKNIHISMCTETFNLWVIAETILYMHDGALAYFGHAVQDVLNNT